MTKSEYYTNLFELTQSLVVKNIDESYMVENWFITLTGGYIGSDKREFQYYRDICGIYTGNTGDVFFVPLQDNVTEPVLFTRDNVNRYTETKKELLKFGKSFRALIDKYPLRSNYIRGCLYNIDLNTAVTAANGTILAYSAAHVGVNEYDLIPGLNKHTTAMCTSTTNIGYMLVDELYVAGRLAVLYATIPNKINELRVGKIDTWGVCDYYMELFFRSNYDIWDYVKNIDRASLLWLYVNTKRLMKSAGKENTLLELAGKLLEPNSVSISAVVQRVGLSRNTTMSPWMLPTNQEPIYILDKLNSVNGSRSKITIDELTTFGLNIDTNTTSEDTRLSFNIDIATREIAKHAYTPTRTGTLLVSDARMFDIGSNTLLERIMSRIYELLFNSSSITGSINTSRYSVMCGSKQYDMYFSEALYTTLDMVYNYCGITLNSGTNISWTSYTGTGAMSDIAMLDGGSLNSYAELIAYMNLSSDVAQTSVSNVEVFSYVPLLAEKIWLLAVNSDNVITEAAIDYLLYKHTQKHASSATDLKAGIVNTAFKYNYALTADRKQLLNEIVVNLSTITGIDLAGVSTVSDVVSNLAEVVKKYVSYTSNVITDTTKFSTIDVYDIGVNPVKLVTPLVSIVDAVISEPVMSKSVVVSAIGDNNLLKSDVINGGTTPIITINPTGGITVTAYIYDNYDNIVTSIIYSPECYMTIE